jgi:uncharacterized protein YkwD
MESRTGIVLGASLALNVLLLVLVGFLWLRQSPVEAATAVVAITPEPSPTAPSPTATPLPEPTVTSTLEPIAGPTLEPTAEPTIEPTAEPTIEPTAEPTIEPTPEPTVEPTPEPTPVVTGPNWLRYANQFRLQGGLPLLTENSLWSIGSAEHSRYMALNNTATHVQEPDLAGYSPDGALAGLNGNIAMSGSADVALIWPFEYWMSASFHALPLLDPQLQRVGYGDYRDARSAAGMTATLDVARGLDEQQTDFAYPLTFPRDGGQMWVTTFNLPEFPDSAAGCPGYNRPTGAPIFVQIGPGDQTPSVTRTELLRGDTAVPHCVFTETTYTNSNPYWQSIGRRILDDRDAIVLLPRSPLEVGQRYSVTVETNGQTISWQFDVVTRPTDY